MTRLVHLLKFENRLAAAATLGGLFGLALRRSSIALPEYLIPVPLHRSRRRARGFDQALELARVIAAQAGVPIRAHSVLRIRATAAQSSLSTARERRRNLRGAFAVVRPLPARAHVAIVDDVMTTGATVGELATLLLRSGAGRVDAWVCVRASTNSK